MNSETTLNRPLIDICRIIQQKIRENNEVAVKEFYNKMWLYIDMLPPIKNIHMEFLIQTTCDKVRVYINSKADVYKI